MPKAFSGDFLTALQAIAPFAPFDPFERSRNPRAFRRATSLGCLRHRLLLHGIHTAEATHAILLKLDRVARVCVGGIFTVEFLAACEQGCAGFVFSHTPVRAWALCDR